MKRNIYASVLFFIVLIYGCKDNLVEDSPHPINDSPEIKLFDNLLFYDGYAETVDYFVPSNIIRVSNAKYVTKMTEEQISSIGNKLELDVTVGAVCDNYDRIGNVCLSLLKKGDNYSKNNIVSNI